MKRYTDKPTHVILLFILCITSGLLVSCHASAQKIIERSEKLRPEWLVNCMPKPSNETFHYQVTEGEHKNLQDARHSCLLNLSTYIKRSYNISEQAVAKIQLEESDGHSIEHENYNFVYNIQGETINILSYKYDEYWEYITYPNGQKVYRCYTLFGIADRVNPSFDHLSFSRKYGVRGFVRSLVVPGWGQLHKGSTLKGATILSSEVALITGILVAENLRSSYVKKMHEQPKHLKAYNTKADNWENVRNIFIGGAAALYVYNLVDALVANGRKRSITYKPVQFAFYPAVGNYNGVTLAFKF